MSNTTPEPGELIYLDMVATNNGYVAGGSYIRLVLPEGFTVQGVDISGVDGRSYFYYASELFQVGNRFYVAVGSIWPNYPRQVRWQLIVDDSIMPGMYQLTADALHRYQGQLYWDKSDVEPILFVGKQFYLPLLIKT